MKAKGFSLVEITIAMMIVSVMLTTAMSVVTASVKSRVRAQRVAFAEALAERMVTEICEQRYEEPGVGGRFGLEVGVGDASRVTFNDVDDYAGLLEKPPVQRDGSRITGADQFVRSVAVEWIEPSALKVSAVETGLKRVVVTVTWSDKTMAMRTVFRTRVWDGATR